MPLVVAAACSALGIAAYGESAMMPNLIAGLATMPLDFLVAIIVVERVLSSRQRKEWDFSLRELARRASEGFVDIMRLVYVSDTPEALRVNIGRYSEFVTLAERHVSDLRSHVEGSSTILGPHTYEMARRVERRITWCLDQLRPIPKDARDNSHLLNLLTQAATSIFVLVREGGWYQSDIAAAEAAVKNTHTEGGRALSDRLTAQTYLLTSMQSAGAASPIRGIGGDVDGEFSVGYFMIDYIILSAAQVASSQGD
jgi:hypothetical protein